MGSSLGEKTGRRCRSLTGPFFEIKEILDGAVKMPET
jgi:hypothetical protein